MSFAAIAIMLLCGFGAGEGEPDLPVTDTTDITIKAYQDGDNKAPYFVVLHHKPSVGQYWETGSDSYGIDSSTRWQITRAEGQLALVEQRVKLDAEMFKSDYVLGFKIKLDAGEGKPNVLKAWIGKPGEEPAEITVTEAPPQRDKPAEKPAPNPDETVEDFAALKLAGGTWAGKLYTRVNGKEISQVWVATDGWFGGVVKVSAGDYVNELQSYGTDAEAILKWPEDVLKAKDERKEDPDNPPDKPEGDQPKKD